MADALAANLVRYTVIDDRTQRFVVAQQQMNEAAAEPATGSSSSHTGSSNGSSAVNGSTSGSGAALGLTPASLSSRGDISNQITGGGGGGGTCGAEISVSLTLSPYQLLPPVGKDVTVVAQLEPSSLMQPNPSADASPAATTGGAATAAARTADTPTDSVNSNTTNLLNQPLDLAAAGLTGTEADIAFQSLFHLAAMLRNGSLTAMQLTALYSRRLQRLNPGLDAVAHYTIPLALQQAMEADKQLQAIRGSNSRKGVNGTSASSSSSSSLSLLLGIPYGLKDLFSVPGYPTSWGLTHFKSRVIDEVSGCLCCQQLESAYASFQLRQQLLVASSLDYCLMINLSKFSYDSPLQN